MDQCPVLVTVEQHRLWVEPLQALPVGKTGRTRIRRPVGPDMLDQVGHLGVRHNDASTGDVPRDPQGVEGFRDSLAHVARIHGVARDVGGPPIPRLGVDDGPEEGMMGEAVSVDEPVQPEGLEGDAVRLVPPEGATGVLVAQPGYGGEEHPVGAEGPLLLRQDEGGSDKIHGAENLLGHDPDGPGVRGCDPAVGDQEDIPVLHGVEFPHPPEKIESLLPVGQGEGKD